MVPDRATHKLTKNRSAGAQLQLIFRQGRRREQRKKYAAAIKQNVIMKTINEAVLPELVLFCIMHIKHIWNHLTTKKQENTQTSFC